MKHKQRISTVLCILLGVAGLGLFLYPTLSDWHTRWQVQREIAQYNQVAPAEQADNSGAWAAAEAYNRTLLEKDAQFVLAEGEAEWVNGLLNPLGNGMMGYIEIPKIHVRLPIYQGIEEKELQSGAGWWIGYSLPTGGESTHCILTAHTGLVKAKMFTDLDQLEEGDLFSLSVLDRKLTYQVNQILLTEPDEAAELYVIDGKDYVTLYTCYPYGVNTHRLLVRGERVSPEAAELLAEETEQSTPWLWLPVIVISCMAAGWLLVRRMKGTAGKKSGGKDGDFREEL